MGLKRGIVVLEDYNDKWKDEYLKEKKLLESVLKDKIIGIEHVGSTSIPGLKSKPIIDICVIVKSLDDVEVFKELLEPYDYHFRGHQGVIDRYFFAKGDEDNRTHYLHLEEKDSDSYQNHILFRDYLINHPSYIKKYEEIKESLANSYSDNREEYTKGKTEFIKNVIELAKEKKPLFISE